MNTGRTIKRIGGVACLACLAQAGDMDATLQALNQFNASMQQLSQQVPQQQAASASEEQTTAVDTSASQRASLDAQIAYLRAKVERQRQNVARAEARLDQAASSGSSTIVLSRTVNSERATLRVYENQLAQLEARRFV